MYAHSRFARARLWALRFEVRTELFDLNAPLIQIKQFSPDLKSELSGAFGLAYLFD